jgi:antitoxin VapB
MTLSIKDSEADRLARELSMATGETITVAVATALRERLERVRGLAGRRDLVTDLLAIADRCASLPVLDDRSAEEILGYDAAGVPS